MKELLRLSTKQFEGKGTREITDFANSFYRHRIQGTTVTNLHLGIQIEFNKDGRKETAVPLMGPVKAAAVIHLRYLLTHAKFSNWGPLKAKHKIKFPTAIGFMNFKAVVSVDGVKKSFRICVLLKKGNKVQYDFHEDSIGYGLKKGKR